MNVLKGIREALENMGEEVLLADGFDDALIGVGERCGQPLIAVYDRDKCIEVLMARDGMTYAEAEEFFSFNVVGSWVGEGTPIFMTRLDALFAVDPPSDPQVKT